MFKKIPALLALVFFATLFSCSSDDNGNASSNGSITATINGKQWSARGSEITARISSVQLDDLDRIVFQFTALKADYSMVGFQFPINSLTTGTFNFEGDVSGQLLHLTPFPNSKIYSSGETEGFFSITITEIDATAKTISGTFSGTLIGENGTSIQLTNGILNKVPFGNTDFYSNGSFSFLKNGSPVSFDAVSGSGRPIWIIEDSFTDAISISGSSIITNHTHGSYNIVIPKDVAPGTYSLTDNAQGFAAGYSDFSEDEYNVTEGSITIVSHIGNSIVATFNYKASNGNNTVNITDGQLTFEHLD